MTIEERLAAAERRIAELERRLGPAPSVPMTLPPSGIPPTHPLPPGFGDRQRLLTEVTVTTTGEWPHNAGSRA